MGKESVMRTTSSVVQKGSDRTDHPAATIRLVLGRWLRYPTATKIWQAHVWRRINFEEREKREGERKERERERERNKKRTLSYCQIHASDHQSAQ